MEDKDITASLAISLALGVILCCWIWKALNWLWFRPKKLQELLRQQGITGSSYKVLYGDKKELSKMRGEALSKPLVNLSNDIFPRVSPFISEAIKHYGDNSFVWMGPRPMVIITDPDLIREVFSRTHDFPNQDRSNLVKSLLPGLASYDGDKWAKHRKLINPAFQMEKLKKMLPAFYASCNKMISEWENLVAGSGSSQSQELDVWPFLVSLTADAISRAAFGSSYDEGSRIFDLLQEKTKITVQLEQSVYIPGWRFLPTKTNNKVKGIDKEIQTLLGGIIHKRRIEMESGAQDACDLLGILMESAGFRNGKASSKRQTLTIREVIDECKLFYFAGHETTSVLLVWTMVLLAQHQEWQTRAREEVLRAFGKSKPDFDGLNQLKTVTMIFYEVLRLYPPVVSLSRMVLNDYTKLGKLNLPKGVSVNLILILAQQDPGIWGDDAKEFNPKRFSEGISKATIGNKISLFPFGWGPRVCVGQNFALIEAKMALAMILQHFTFELSPFYVHAPHTAITLHPQHGAKLILHQR